MGANTTVATSYHETMSRSLAMDNTGNFVVVWTDGVVRAQRYTSAGKKTGTQIVVGNSNESAVAMNGSGQFVVAWSSGDGNWAQVVSARGAPVGGPVQINTTQGVGTVGLAMDNAGNVVFTWTLTNGANGPANEVREVYFRRLTALGLLEPAYLANTTTQAWQAGSSRRHHRHGFVRDLLVRLRRRRRCRRVHPEVRPGELATNLVRKLSAWEASGRKGNRRRQQVD